MAPATSGGAIGRRWWIALMAACLMLAGARRAGADDKVAAGKVANDNVVVNGDLSKGTGESPDHWQGDGWQNGPEYSTYTWHHSGTGPGELEVASVKANDARWIQKVHIGPDGTTSRPACVRKTLHPTTPAPISP